MKQQNTKKKLSREAREKIDNKVVLATAIALVSAMLLLFLMNWSQSAYFAQTVKLIQILQWAGVAGIALFLVLAFVKDKKYLYCLPYCAAASLFMVEILRGTVSTFFVRLFGKIPFLKIAGNYATTGQRFSTLFICLAIYLVASYIYYAVKLRKLTK